MGGIVKYTCDKCGVSETYKVNELSDIEPGITKRFDSSVYLCQKCRIGYNNLLNKHSEELDDLTKTLRAIHVIELNKFVSFVVGVDHGEDN